ncbi:MAG: hypothetical protein JST14_15750 [Bacteroidetes bacterium]|nr:hypothetical protein [Bacteroidota bacterium]
MSPLSLRVFLRYFIVFLALWGPLVAVAQRRQQIKDESRRGSSIIDDTTRNVYGPQTSMWTTEDEIFMNRAVYRPLDTTIHNYHRWMFTERFFNKYKDLGVMGTALSPIFPQVGTMIGAHSGFYGYEPYYSTEQVKYFNTRSPYTRMQVIWGGSGRAMTRIEFSRNINPRWNFGFNYRPILVLKQIQSKGRGDYQTVSHYYDIYSSYSSKNGKYTLLFNFQRIRHRVYENGGVTMTADDPQVKIWDPNQKPNLLSARVEDYRRNIHFFQQFQLAKPFQVYHIADFYKQTNGYTDDLNVDGAFYDYSMNIHRTDSLSPSDQTTFVSMRQEAGIKGRASGFFYSAYFRLRTYNYSNHLLDTVNVAPRLSGTESYLGGRMVFNLDSVTSVNAFGEFLFGGFYRLEGVIESPWLEGYFRSTRSKPGLMQMAYRGSHDNWNQTFEGIQSTQAQGFVKAEKSSIQVKAGGTFTALSNYVYFKEVLPAAFPAQSILPVQSSGKQVIFSPEVRVSFRFFRHFYFRPQVIYTALLQNDDKAIKIPEWFVNTQLAYENELFNKHLQIQAGVDVHYKSAYQALGYDPAIQQFYVQDRMVSPAFPLVDVYVNGKMRRGRFFVRFHNMVQMVTAQGYIPTPAYPTQSINGGYPGQRNAIDFGFDFLMFD